MNEIKVSEFNQAVRNRLGDSSQSVPASYWISYLNTALRRLARQDGLEKLFENRKSINLAAINKDGTPSAAWSLGKIGPIIDIVKMRVLKTVNSEVCDITPRYVEYDHFFDAVPLPERQRAGDPDYYTVEQIGAESRILFNRPIKDVTAIDIVFSAFHPKITSEDDILQINYAYQDILEEYVLILHKIETTDMATARSLWEDLDVLTADARELLAKRKTSSPLRSIKRSF